MRSNGIACCGVNCGLDSGLGDLNDIYVSISNLAGSGNSSLGEISALLLNLGLGIEAARGALQTVAANVGGDPQRLAAINAELAYLNSGSYAVAPNRNAWVFPVLALGALWLLTRD